MNSMLAQVREVTVLFQTALDTGRGKVLARQSILNGQLEQLHTLAMKKLSLLLSRLDHNNQTDPQLAKSESTPHLAPATGTTMVVSAQEEELLRNLKITFDSMIEIHSVITQTSSHVRQELTGILSETEELWFQSPLLFPKFLQKIPPEQRVTPLSPSLSLSLSL